MFYSPPSLQVMLATTRAHQSSLAVTRAGSVLLLCSYFTNSENKQRNNERLHPKSIPRPFPRQHLPEQSANPAAPQSYLDAETVWEEIQGFPEGTVY